MKKNVLVHRSILLYSFIRVLVYLCLDYDYISKSFQFFAGWVGVFYEQECLGAFSVASDVSSAIFKERKSSKNCQSFNGHV